MPTTLASSNTSGGPYAVTVTASDGTYSSSATCTWNITHTDTATPTLTNPGTQTNVAGDSVTLALTASDPDGDTLSYAASGLPIGLMIDPSTGLISGTVDYSAAEIAGGQYNVTVSVNDGNGDTATQSFVWTIADTEQGP